MSQYNPPLFDEKLQTPEMKALKAVLPYMEPSVGKMAAVFVKMLEIKSIIDMFESEIAVQAAEPEKSSRMLSALRSSCGEQTAGVVEFMQRALEIRKMADMLRASGITGEQEE